MAGSFGFEAGTTTSRSPSASACSCPPCGRPTPDTLIIADGFSCREQIAGLTGRGALHLAQVIQMALHEGPEGPTRGPARDGAISPSGKWTPGSPDGVNGAVGRQSAARVMACGGPGRRSRNGLDRGIHAGGGLTWPGFPQSPALHQQQTKVHEIDGVQVYGRKGPEGRSTNLDAIDEDEEKIRRIADRLQRRGYGVMRQRHNRAGRVYHSSRHLGRTGAPPDDPFSQESTGRSTSS